jgi:uncharacterized membrane protein (Fun14 family)
MMWVLPLLVGVGFLVGGVEAWAGNPLVAVVLWVIGAALVSFSYRHRVRRP